MCERCPLAKLCESGEADKTPFTKELFCQLTTLGELAGNEYKQQKQPETKTYSEFYNEWLWLFRNSITSGLKAVFDYSEIGKSYAIVAMLYNTVCELITDYNASFIKQAVLPIQAQMRVFDDLAKQKKTN
jgi:hypothetical protein